jgi:hypothetical protein
MKYLTLIFLLGGLAVALKGGPAAPGDTGMGFESAVTAVARAVGQAQQMEIYEGLPREKAAFDTERNKAVCRQITDQWFYSVPEDFRYKHIVKLQRLLGIGLLQPWREGKVCGGFHADFAVAVTGSQTTIYVLFCFGCHEARIIREGNPFAANLQAADFRVTTDLDAKSFEDLRTLLTGYHSETHDGTPLGG